MKLMNYRKEKEDVFAYTGDKIVRKKIKFIKKSDNPFKKLMSLNLK